MGGRQEAKATVGRMDFLTEEEQSEGVETTAARRFPWKSDPSEGWEVALATRVLPVFGGILLLVGAAIGATLIEGAFAPLLRVALGYVLTAALVGVGWFARKRSTPVGQATIACGLALGYFTSFGGHFLAPMRVLPLAVSLGAMLLFVGILVLLADRWRSQPMAAFGLVLGVVAALVSAPVAETFALVSLAGLSLAAGGLFLRREWMGLTTGAVSLVYVAFLLLWVIAPVPESAGAVLAHLGALVGVHAVFAVAFMRWGRPWLARERALREGVQEGTLPAIKPGTLPFASGFTIVNSLGVVALGTLLLWTTRVFWAEVHWFLFALTAAEALRLALPMLRGRWEQSFHAMLAFVLLSCGVVSLFSGLAESAVLAGAALAAAIAATRAPMLRIIRPLGALAAALSGAAYLDQAWPIPTIDSVFGHVAALLPPIFLLASALPWERLGTVEFVRPHWFFRATEALSAPFRALVAVILGLVHVVTQAPTEELTFVLVAATALLLAGGMALLGARAWGVALLAALGTFAVGAEEVGREALTYGVTILLTLAVPLLLTDAWRKTAFLWPRRGVALLGAIVALMLMMLNGVLFENLAGWTGGVLWGTTLLLLGGTFLLKSTARLPSLAREGIVGDGETIPEPRWAFSPGMLSALIIGLLGWCWAVLNDSQTGIVSPALVGATLLILSVPPIASRVPVAWRPLGGFLGALAWAVAWSIWREGAVGAAFVPALLAAMFGGAALLLPAMRPLLSAAPAAAVIAILVTLFPILREDALGAGTEAFAALAATLLVACGLFLSVAVQRRGLGLEEAVGPWKAVEAPALHGLLGVVGVTLTLFVLGLSNLLPGPLITPSWGALGAALLLAGLLLGDRTLRFTALGVFVVSVARVFLHDAVGLDAITRAVAFLGVGLLLVAGGVAYGLARRRLLASQAASADKDE